MPAEMDLLYTLERKFLQIGERLGAVVRCRHQDIVDVEQQSASGSPGYFDEKIDLPNRAFGKANVCRWIFQQHLSPECGLHLVDMLGDPRQRLFGVG